MVIVRPYRDTREIETEEFAEILDCEKRSCCCVATVPGAALDRLAQKFNQFDRNIIGLCNTHASVESLTAVGVSALLIHDLILDIVCKPFRPSGSRLRALKLQVDRMVYQAAKEVSCDLSEYEATPKEIGNDLLRARPKLSLPQNFINAFWRCAAIKDNIIISEWTGELSSDPAVLVEYLQSRKISVVFAVNGSLLDDVTRDLLIMLATKDFKVIIGADPRSEVEDPWRSIDQEKIHGHHLSVSADRSVQVLEALSKTRPGVGQKLLSLSSSGPAKFSFITDIYETREKLIAALGTGLAQIPGLTPKKRKYACDPCNIGINDLRGKSVLLVVHRKEESIALSRSIGNYLTDAVTVIGNQDLWKGKLKELCLVLDPLGQVSGDEDSLRRAGSLALESIFLAISKRFRLKSNMLEYFGIEIVLDGDTADDDNISQSENRVEIYRELVENVVQRLSSVSRKGSPEAFAAARETIGVLNRHIGLLEQDGQEKTFHLIQLTHEIFDLRALGYEQANSGSQRWYPWASTYRARGGDRLEIAADLDRLQRNPWQPAVSLFASEKSKAAVYISHIQRLGNDLADHVIICRTSSRHMPCISDTADPHREEVMFYRAVASARESVHMLSVGESPFLLERVRDHRGVSTTDLKTQ